MSYLRSIKPVRSYAGERFTTRTTNKKYLDIDFAHRCGYCGDHYQYSGGYNSFHVDHFAPKSRFKELEFTYDNLVFSCPFCNAAKSDKWIGTTADQNIVSDEGFIDPCKDEYDLHLERDSHGNIISKTKIGEYMHTELKLYLTRHAIIYNLERLRKQRLLIKTKIDSLKPDDERVHKLRSVYTALCEYFCDYYDLFFVDLEETDELFHEKIPLSTYK